MKYGLLLIAACGATAHAPPRPTDGAIGGIARDRETGEGIGFATVRLLRGSAVIDTTQATHEGFYGFDHLAPGRYSLDGEMMGARARVTNVGVVAGLATIADVELERGSAMTYNLDDEAEIEYFTPPSHGAATGEIVGVVGDVATHAPVEGAVVTIVRGDNTQQTITDAAGRYRFTELLPGSYSVSAYYGVEGHAQIELRRSGIAVTAGGGARVPLFIETAR